MTSNTIQFIKFILTAIAIAITIYIINKLIGRLELVLGVILVSLGVMSIIWTLLARSNLSPNSSLRLFANNFLACSIAILTFTIIVIINKFTDITNLIYIQYILIFFTYFFFIIASYYIYTIGKEFGFQQKGFEIESYLKKQKSLKKKKF